MSRGPRLPLAARLLLRVSPVPRDERDAVSADLLELFESRRASRGTRHAHVRLYHDIASLWRLPLVSDARIDLRFAVRLFARQPVILLLTVIGLALGLGVATSAFTIMNAAVLRGDGLIDSDRAPGVLRTAGPDVSTVWEYREFAHLRDGATRLQLEAVHASPARVQASSGDGAEMPSVVVAFVSGGFFPATGGRVIAGRPLQPSDETASGPSAVVVNFVFWKSRLGGDPAAIGRTIRVGRADAIIVGIAERGFAVPRGPVLWTPLTAYGAVYGASASRTASISVEVFGRLRPDASIAEAEAQLSGVAAALPADRSAGGEAVAVRLDPDTGLGRSSAQSTLAITLFVFVMIGLILLLACANVATVLVSTAITREREMAVRAALGASRRRIVRQLVTESLALGALASAIGLMFTYWAIPIVARTIEAPDGSDLAPDLTVFVFLGIVTLVAGVGAGLAPARHGRGADLVSPLKGETRQDRVAPRRLRSALVMTQAAVSVLLIVLATLFVRATFQAAALDIGFDPAGLYAVAPGVEAASSEQGAEVLSFWTRASAAVRDIPGVRALSVAESTPIGGITRSARTREEPARVVYFNGTGASYFETMGFRMLAGRSYTQTEVTTRAAVAVISESLARAYWPDRSPLGEPLAAMIPVAGPRPIVIGVAADAITAHLHERNTFAVYEPIRGDLAMFARLMIRIEPGAAGSLEQASRRLRALDPQGDVRISSIEARVRQELNRPRMLAALTGTVGVIAIVLCVIGLYGLTASVVGQRSREMAVRAAIGADRRDLLRLLMRESLRPVVVGLTAGAAVAFMAGRLAASVVFFGVSPEDPVAFAAAIGTLLGAATLAVLVPTRRAAAVDAALVLKGS